MGVTLLIVAAGLLLVGLSIPLVLRRVKPNPLYGLRVPATFSDEWVWYEANARSGRDLLIVGLAVILTAVVLRLAQLDELIYGLLNAGVMLSGVFLCAIVGWRRANRLLRERRGPVPPG